MEIVQTIREAVGQDAAALQKLGVALSQLSDFDTAENLLREAFAADPTNPEPILQIAQMRSVQGDNLAALKAVRTAYEMQPMDSNILAALRNILIGLNREDTLKSAISETIDETEQLHAGADDHGKIYLPLSQQLLPMFEQGLPIVLYDIGARDALSDPRWTALPSHATQLHGFEPDEAECHQLTEAAAEQNFDFRYHPYALWSKTAQITFEHNAASGGGSVLPQNRTVTDRWKFINAQQAQPATDVFYPVRTETMDAITLSDWRERSGASMPDFLKLNVQGGEIEILSGGPEMMDSSLGILLEVGFVESYMDRPFFSDVDVFLRKHGFVFFDFLSHHYVGRAASSVTARHLRKLDSTPGNQRSAWGQLIEAHAIYLRDPIAHPGRFESVESYLKLAVLAELFGQIDFAYEIVDAAGRRFSEKTSDLSEATQSSRESYLNW